MVRQEEVHGLCMHTNYQRTWDLEFELQTCDCLKELKQPQVYSENAHTSSELKQDWDINCLPLGEGLTHCSEQERHRMRRILCRLPSTSLQS